MSADVPSVTAVNPPLGPPTDEELLALYVAHRLAEANALRARVSWQAALARIEDLATRDEARHRAARTAHANAKPEPRT